MEIEKLFKGLDLEIEELQDQMKFLFQENQRLAALINDLQRNQEKDSKPQTSNPIDKIQKDMRKTWIKTGL